MVQQLAELEEIVEYKQLQLQGQSGSSTSNSTNGNTSTTSNVEGSISMTGRRNDSPAVRACGVACDVT